jgi:hypothetical protein
VLVSGSALAVEEGISVTAAVSIEGRMMSSGVEVGVGEMVFTKVGVCEIVFICGWVGVDAFWHAEIETSKDRTRVNNHKFLIVAFERMVYKFPLWFQMMIEALSLPEKKPVPG